MALVLRSEYSTANTDGDCDNILIDDATGDYNAVDNTGGWGAPNPERADFGLYLVLTKKKTGDDEDLVDSTNDGVANSIDQFTITSVGDGWYNSQLLAFPNYDAAQAYGVNQIIYFSSNLYICTITTSPGEDPIGTPSKWTLFESTATNLRLVLASVVTYSPTVTIYTSSDDIFETCTANKIYADAIEDQASGCSKCYEWEDARDISVLLEGAKIAFARNRYSDADKKIQVVNDYGDGNKCTDC